MSSKAFEKAKNVEKKKTMRVRALSSLLIKRTQVYVQGRIQGEGAGGAHPPRDAMRFSKTTGILQQKQNMWFIGVEVEQETNAPPPRKNPGSAPDV